MHVLPLFPPDPRRFAILQKGRVKGGRQAGRKDPLLRVAEGEDAGHKVIEVKAAFPHPDSVGAAEGISRNFSGLFLKQEEACRRNAFGKKVQEGLR